MLNCTNNDFKSNAIASGRLSVALTADVSDGTYRKPTGRTVV